MRNFGSSFFIFRKNFSVLNRKMYSSAGRAAKKLVRHGFESRCIFFRNLFTHLNERRYYMITVMAVGMFCVGTLLVKTSMKWLEVDMRTWRAKMVRKLKK